MSEESRKKELKYWNLLFAFAYALTVAYPFLDAYVMGRVSFDRQIDPELMTGLLTASSILFGFSSLIILSQEITRKERRKLWWLIFPPLIFIILSGSGIADVALGKANAVRTTLILIASFNANVLTTVFLVGYSRAEPKKRRRKKRDS